jgi:hypothetical protein
MPALLGLAETSRQHNGLGIPASSAIDAASSSRLKHPAELSALRITSRAARFHCRPTDHGERLRFSPIASYRKRSPASVSRVMSRDGHATAPMTRAESDPSPSCEGSILHVFGRLPPKNRPIGRMRPFEIFRRVRCSRFYLFQPEARRDAPFSVLRRVRCGLFCRIVAWPRRE